MLDDPRLQRSRRGTTLFDPHEAPPPSLCLRLPDGRRHALGRRTVIGSAGDCDVVLDDPYVSGSHCVVFRDGQKLRLHDPGSHNGVLLGNVRVRDGELRAGMKVTVGRTALRVVAEGAPGEGAMVGAGPAMQELRRQIERFGPSRLPVLLLGESGTGKELAAQALHAASGRTGRFLPVNCGALAPELVESDLFGHEKGAFTGAGVRKPGVFEEADGGTLFLDEIGELPPALQPKLLRALESGHVRAVGAPAERRVDVRVVAATHRDVKSAVGEGGFRLDLYHRLLGLELRVPPLRERVDDIPRLARHFLDAIADETGPRELSTAALARLSTWPWPGNVRELKHAVQQAACLVDGPLIDAEHLRLVDVAIGRREPQAGAERPGPGLRAGEPLPPLYVVEGRSFGEMERDAIADALRRHGTSRKAAQALGIPKSTFCDKVRRYGLNDQGSARRGRGGR